MTLILVERSFLGYTSDIPATTDRWYVGANAEKAHTNLATHGAHLIHRSGDDLVAGLYAIPAGWLPGYSVK